MKIPIRYKTASEALSVVQSNQRVFVHGSAQTPTLLLKALAEEADRLRNVEVVSISVYGDMMVDKPGMEESFRVNSLFVSAGVR